MKTWQKIMGLTLISLCTKAALAQTPIYDQSKTFYLPVSIGGFYPDHSRELNNSFYGAVGVGYNFTNVLGLQTQFGMFSPNSRSVPSNSAMNAYLWLVEGRANVISGNFIVPYAVLGLGTLGMPGAEMVEDYGLGVDFKLSPVFSVGATARQIYQNNNHNLNTLLTGNVTWYFGGDAKNIQQPATPQLTADQQHMLQKAQTTLKPVLPEGVVVCKDNKLGNQAGCVTFAGDTMTMHLNVHFEQNKADIQSQYNTPIQSVGNFMNAYPSTTTTLYGYASSEGPAAFNQTLSLQRAQSVEDYLNQVCHIDKSRMQVVGMGTKDPIASNATLAGRKLNRRVESTIPVPYNLDH